MEAQGSTYVGVPLQEDIVEYGANNQRRAN